MTKLMTEDQFTSDFALKILEPIFLNSQNIRIQLIITKRILEYEYNKTLDDDNFLRKSSAIAAVLCALMSSNYGKEIFDFLLPAGLSPKRKEKIRTLYGTYPVKDIPDFYKKSYAESEVIEEDPFCSEFIERIKK